MSKLRDALKEAQRAQLLDEADWEAKLERCVKAYRAFVKKHGRIKEFTALRADHGRRTTKARSHDGRLPQVQVAEARLRSMSRGRWSRAWSASPTRAS
jgi:N12 class adenine-specific DNA methylase